MDIADAATFFDDDPVYDAYTGLLLFYGQTASFDDSSSDGATNRRRVLSVAPDIVMPTRGGLKLYSDLWIVGTGTPDGFQGDPVRRHFSMKRVTNLAALLTPTEALAASVGTPVYIHKHYFKEVVNAGTSADVDNYWNVFIPPGEAASRGSFLRLEDDTLLRVRNDYLPVEGLRVLQSDQLDVGARTTAVFRTGTLNRATDTVSSGTSTVNAIVIEPSKFYRFEHMSEPAIQKGDMTVFVPTTITPRVDQQFAMSGKNWRVLYTVAENGCWALLARLA